jgi:hypothetical protein
MKLDNETKTKLLEIAQKTLDAIQDPKAPYTADAALRQEAHILQMPAQFAAWDLQQRDQELIVVEREGAIAYRVKHLELLERLIVTNEGMVRAFTDIASALDRISRK